MGYDTLVMERLLQEHLMACVDQVYRDWPRGFGTVMFVDESSGIYRMLFWPAALEFSDGLPNAEPRLNLARLLTLLGTREEELTQLTVHQGCPSTTVFVSWTARSKPGATLELFIALDNWSYQEFGDDEEEGTKRYLQQLSCLLDNHLSNAGDEEDDEESGRGSLAGRLRWLLARYPTGVPRSQPLTEQERRLLLEAYAMSEQLYSKWQPKGDHALLTDLLILAGRKADEQQLVGWTRQEWADAAVWATTEFLLMAEGEDTDDRGVPAHVQIFPEVASARD
jgi:hypothetical protein